MDVRLKTHAYAYLQAEALRRAAGVLNGIGLGDKAGKEKPLKQRPLEGVSLRMACTDASHRTEDGLHSTKENGRLPYILNEIRVNNYFLVRLLP